VRAEIEEAKRASFMSTESCRTANDRGLTEIRTHGGPHSWQITQQYKWRARTLVFLRVWLSFGDCRTDFVVRGSLCQLRRSGILSDRSSLRGRTPIPGLASPTNGIDPPMHFDPANAQRTRIASYRGSRPGGVQRRVSQNGGAHGAPPRVANGRFWCKADIARLRLKSTSDAGRSSRTTPALKIGLAAIGRLTRRRP
jgi:hypothetical protein